MNRPSPAPPRRFARQNWRNTLGRELRRDSRTLIAHRDRDPGSAAYQRRLDHGSYGTSTVPHGVLNKVGQDLVDLVGI